MGISLPQVAHDCFVGVISGPRMTGLGRLPPDTALRTGNCHGFHINNCGGVRHRQGSTHSGQIGMTAIVCYNFGLPGRWSGQFPDNWNLECRRKRRSILSCWQQATVSKCLQASLIKPWVPC